MPSNRPTLLEGGSGESLSNIGATIGLPIDTLRRMFLESSGRLRRELHLREEPFTFIGDMVSSSGISGVIRLGPRVEIEIIPKCFDPRNANWRNDFMVMAAVTKLGRILRREQVSARFRTEHRDVLSLLAALFLEEFERLSRVPIREYVRSSWIDSNIDGELDYGEFWQSYPDGFVQDGVRLSVENQFMGVIGEAAHYLGTASADRGIGQRLCRLATAFHSVVKGRIAKRVPGRYVRWQQLYDMAVAIRTGLGMQLSPDGALRAPGFVLNTERGWEDLLTLSLKTQGSSLRAREKPKSILGVRYPSGDDVVTRPDLVLNPPSVELPIVVDAKYKGTAVRPLKQIASEDLYESLAFLEAQQCDVAVLVYPGSSLAEQIDIGMLMPFDEVTVGSRRVIGARVSTNGVGRARGLAVFGRRLGESLLEVARHPTVAAERTLDTSARF